MPMQDMTGSIPMVGDRVRVVIEPHMKGHTDGVVRQVVGGALGIEFDAMPGEIHHWYVASEVMVVGDKKPMRDGDDEDMPDMPDMRGQSGHGSSSLAGYWLLSPATARTMRQAIATGWVPTVDQMLAHERTEIAAAAGPLPRGMQVAGDTAEIRIEGTLTPKPDLFAMFFGGGNTTYRDIQAGLMAAAQDPAIRNIVLAIDSPGGSVAGLFETLAAIENVKANGKRITVRATNAHSAAYALAAVAGKIRAETPASMFGSVGVVASFFVDEEVVDITNTDSPNKRPNLTTPDGQDVIRQELDALFELFADAIARGRGVDIETVKKDFGRGASFVAADAAKRKMIDSAPRLSVARAEDDSPGPVATVGDAVAVVTPQLAPISGRNARKTTMTKDELKAQHPDIYAAIHAEGVASERERVGAHLTLADASGDMKTARDAIASGDGLTPAVQAKHMAASMNRRDVAARQADSDAAGAAVDGARPTGDEKKDLVDTFAALLPEPKSKH